MKVLLDTNIIIHRETKNPEKQEIGKLFYWLDELGYKKYIHKVTLDEISKNKNVKARDSFFIKLQNYHQLPTVASLQPELKKISTKYDKNENDKNDTILLNEVFCGRIDILITEDKKIHEKSQELGIEEKVYTIDQFLEKANLENPGFIDYDVLSIKQKYFGDIDLKDGFFFSFKEDYIDFEKWFNKKSDELAYVCESDGEIIAFLYLKVEREDEPYSDIEPLFKPKKRLKIGTLKVDLNGYRLGERFLKIIFDNALRLSIDEIYVTIFKTRLEHTRLINLLTTFGFKHHGIKKSESGTEEVYTRDFSKKVSIMNPKITYPYISKNTQKFLVSIYPKYHTELLPDSILKTESHTDFEKNESHRNAISKVFVSRSIKRDLKSGDIIIFYRTGGIYRGVITTIGIVEKVITSIKDENQFIELCRKRSVFSDENLKEQWNWNKRYRPFIVKFLYCYTFPKKINLKRLIEIGIINDIESVPRGFEKISNESFEKIIEETGCNEDIIVD
jgi:predicted nucleic acid-binding protein